MKRKVTMPDGEITTVEMPRFKTPWNHDTRTASKISATYNKDPSKTKQEFKESTDINVILERFKRTNEAPPMVLPEHFIDLTERPTYFDINRKVAKANEMFYNLPASTRATFLNDPTRWADTVVRATVTGNVELLNEIGIAATRKAQEPPPGGKPATPAADHQTAPEPPKGAPKGAQEAPKSDNPPK